VALITREARARAPGRWLAVALTVGAIGFAGCGDESEGEGETTAAPTVAGSATDLGASGDAILIRTQVNLPTGVSSADPPSGTRPFAPAARSATNPGRQSWLNGKDRSLP
jgi:hypothetical protein